MSFGGHPLFLPKNLKRDMSVTSRINGRWVGRWVGRSNCSQNTVRAPCGRNNLPTTARNQTVLVSQDLHGKTHIIPSEYTRYPLRFIFCKGNAPHHHRATSGPTRKNRNNNHQSFTVEFIKKSPLKQRKTKIIFYIGAHGKITQGYLILTKL